MSRFKDIAKNVVGSGGEYISLDDLIATYPQGITINGAFLRETKESGEIACFTFTEDATRFFFANSGDLKKLVDAWAAECKDDFNKMDEILKHEQIKLKITKVQTKTRKTYVKVYVLDVPEDFDDLPL